MKIKTLAFAAGVSAPLILGGSADAGFVGIKVAGKPNEFGLFVCNVYAEFDRPGEDFMQAVTGTADFPFAVQVLGGGSFYNHAFTGDFAPNALFFPAFPSIAYDTFVTIGAKVSSDALPDQTFTTPGTGSVSGFQFSGNQSGWYVIPGAPQSDPFNPDYSGNGQILLGQFSTLDGPGVSIGGFFLLTYTSNGVSEQTYVNFCHGAEGSCPVCPGDCGDFDGNVGIVDFLALLAVWGMPGTPCDIDGSGFVGITDFLTLLANWGPCPEQPTGACCMAGDVCEQRTLQACNGTWKLAGSSCDDYNGMSNICTDVCPWDCGIVDGTVGVDDLLALLGRWGGPGGCDIDGDGVGVSDFIALVTHWGSCP